MSLGDLGKHCMDLQKKLDHVNSIMKIDQMAQKLFVEAESEAPMIEDKKNEICVKYEGLQESIQRYREQLGIAGNMHAFQRNIDETLESVIQGCNITAHRIVNYSTSDDQLQHVR